MAGGPADAFIAEAFALLGVAVAVILLRIYARWSSVGFQNLALDDYLMVFAGAVYALETSAAYTVVAIFFGLANNGMTDEQRRMLRPTDPEWDLRVRGSKTQLVGWSLYTCLLWSLKLAMAKFYSRLTVGLHMNMRINIAYGSIAVTYLATVLSIHLGCLPYEKNWQLFPNPGNHCQPAISKINLYVTVVLNVITDIYLMSIPLPLLWKANITPKRKALLLVMFSGGAFVIIAGILRCALIIADPVNGAAQAGSWAVRETFMAAIIGNIPMIYPLFARTAAKLHSSVLSSALGGSTGSNSTAGSGDFPKPSKPARRKANLMSMGLTSLGGGDSAERIVGNAPSAAVRQPAVAVPPSPNGISVATEFVTTTDTAPHSASLDTRDRDDSDAAMNAEDVERGLGDTRRTSFTADAFTPRPGYSVQCEPAGQGTRKPPPRHWG